MEILKRDGQEIMIIQDPAPSLTKRLEEGLPYKGWTSTDGLIISSWKVGEEELECFSTSTLKAYIGEGENFWLSTEERIKARKHLEYCKRCRDKLEVGQIIYREIKGMWETLDTLKEEVLELKKLQLRENDKVEGGKEDGLGKNKGN